MSEGLYNYLMYKLNRDLKLLEMAADLGDTSLDGKKYRLLKYRDEVILLHHRPNH